MLLTIKHKDQKFEQVLQKSEEVVPSIDKFLKAHRIPLSEINIYLDCQGGENSLSCRAARSILETLKLSVDFLEK